MQKVQKLKSLRLQIDKLWHGREKTSDGDYEKIVNLYFQILKLEPKDTNAWEDTVWLLWSLSINKKNVRYLDTAEKVVLDYLKHNNNGYRAYEYVGQFYRIMMVDEKLAIRYYESALRWKDAPETTFHSLTSLYVKNGDKISAIGNCRFNLKRYPNDPYAKSKLKELSK